ncbi:MAG: hypothetical protein KI793_06380 [Rivularia sp. (in: Bacteria)]|nr:hypothetical protein [Rivularia sp. MS3]
MNSENNPQDKHHEHHLLETGIGAAGGGVAGALVGKIIGGKAGTVVGAVTGAVAGGIIGDAVSDDVEELERKAMETLGEAKGENEVPHHYSWDELAALSKPQNI